MNAMRKLLVSGKVQNVGYRNWVICRAQALRLTGWVRNLADGRVEMLLSGEETAIDAMTEACREGPQHARVDQIEAAPADERLPKGFTKRFTAQARTAA